MTIPTAPMQYQWHSDSWCPAGTATPPPPPLGTLALPAPQCQPRRHGDTGATTSELFSLWRHSPLAASTKRPPAQAAMQCQRLPSAAGRLHYRPFMSRPRCSSPAPVVNAAPWGVARAFHTPETASRRSLAAHIKRGMGEQVAGREHSSSEAHMRTAPPSTADSASPNNTKRLFLMLQNFKGRLYYFLYIPSSQT